MFGDNLERIVAGIEKNYEADEIFFTKPGRKFPSRSAIKTLLKDTRRVLFPGYFGEEMLSPYTSPSYFIGDTLMQIERVLRQQVIVALRYTADASCDEDQIERRTNEICTAFFDELPQVQRVLLTDVQALFDGDPAAGSKEEVIFTYPGLYAIYVYRIAHVLFELGVPIIPRVMTELAHSGTGIDIGAGATIGEYFFIDHGTGVVIGETTEIGDHVKIYQGVTLG
ncbi:MAG: serine acetyltransferase, partial [Eggerthellaceae bacterium]|nr:serine acetyltransferase [Eggerthellaceae bacterium]